MAEKEPTEHVTTDAGPDAHGGTDPDSVEKVPAGAAFARWLRAIPLPMAVAIAAALLAIICAIAAVLCNLSAVQSSTQSAGSTWSVAEAASYAGDSGDVDSSSSVSLSASSGVSYSVIDTSGSAVSATTVNASTLDGAESLRQATLMPFETSYEIRQPIPGLYYSISDLPYAYQISPNLSNVQLNQKTPAPVDGQTVLNAAVDPNQVQVFYLWEEGNMPSSTEFTEDMSDYYYDDYDFRPYVTTIPVPAGVEVKGAIVLLPGGGFEERVNYTDTLPAAYMLRELGYQCFIVDYRILPYSQEEGALDVARAVRFAIAHAQDYGYNAADIAIMGFSAGGMQSGTFLLGFDGLVNGSVLDYSYVPDELDTVPADVAAAAMIYSYYGTMEGPVTDVALLQSESLPPTFYCFGTLDYFYDWISTQIPAVIDAGVPVTSLVFQGWPHGFGAAGGWIPDYSLWLEAVFEAN